VNCVIATNTSSPGAYPNVYHKDNPDANSSSFWYTCAMTTNAALLAAGQGNRTNNPLFVGSGDWRLGKFSPCINAGTTQPWMSGTNVFDLDGSLRVVDGTVDMGAYEYPVRTPSGTAIFIR
jgi:hypothetical protein